MDLAGRVFSQQLDRDKPLWEVWLVEGLEDDRFAVLSKTHHALVDGVSGGTSSRSCSTRRASPPRPPAPATVGCRGRCPVAPSCSARRCSNGPPIPGEIVRSVRAVFRGPRRILSAARDAAVGVGAMAWTGLNPAPAEPVQRRIGPHRRFTWVRAELRDIKAIKDSLGGTVNDVVLATVAGALGRHLRRRGQNTDGLELKAMVPVSVRAGRGARGARQQRRGDHGAAAGLVPGAGGPARHRPSGAQGPQVRRPGRGSAGAHRPVRLRTAHDHGPGVAADGPPALLQPRRHERARAAVPALPARAPDAGPVPDGAARAGPGAGRGAAVLRRRDQLRRGGRLRPAVGPGRARAATSRARWPSWPPRPEWS